jgi:hypothetical protein
MGDSTTVLMYNYLNRDQNLFEAVLLLKLKQA